MKPLHHLTKCLKRFNILRHFKRRFGTAWSADRTERLSIPKFALQAVLSAYHIFPLKSIV
jgi:hypothetical protein